MSLTGVEALAGTCGRRATVERILGLHRRRGATVRRVRRRLTVVAAGGCRGVTCRLRGAGADVSGSLRSGHGGRDAATRRLGRTAGGIVIVTDILKVGRGGSVGRVHIASVGSGIPGVPGIRLSERGSTALGLRRVVGATRRVLSLWRSLLEAAAAGRISRVAWGEGAWVPGAGVVIWVTVRVAGGARV